MNGPTRGQAAGPRWRQTSRGLHVPADTPTDVPEQRVLEQSLRLPAGGAVTGWAACRLRGTAFLDGLEPDGTTEIPVPLALGPRGNIRSDSRIAVSYERLDPREVGLVHGIPATLIARATFDAMRRTACVRDSTVVMDMVAAAGRISIQRMRAYAGQRGGWRATRQVMAALDLASEHSRSPNETRLRLIWVLDAGLPPPHVNCPVRDRTGNLLGIADLLDEEAGLAVEFDGADHRGIGRHTRDVAKEDRFRSHRIEVARVTGTDLRDVGLVVRRLHAARSRAWFVPPADRTWTARPPDDVVEAALCERELNARIYAELDAQPVPDLRELRGW